MRNIKYGLFRGQKCWSEYFYSADLWAFHPAEGVSENGSKKEEIEDPARVSSSWTKKTLFDLKTQQRVSIVVHADWRKLK